MQMSKRARRRKPSSFQRVLADLSSRNGFDPADCAHLERWRHDERWDDLWTAILSEMQKQHHVQVPAEFADEFAELILAPFFVTNVLAIRHLAEQVDDRPNYRARADEADSLAKFLRRLPPPVPTIPNGLELASKLEEAALIMRAQANRSRMRVSRQGRGHQGLQQQGIFVRQ